MSNDMPIGIFDSGVGGLTVMKEIIRALPEEHILYLGDTARVPYGGRSSETVLRYSVENTRALVSRGIKLLVVACNTSSAVSLDILREQFSVPVIGVVEPGARAAVEMTSRKKVAVIGTETTINSGSYETAIKAIDGSIEVVGVSCPLFVPLIEEGWTEGEIVDLTARKYIASMNHDVDTVVLGCTHYPMIKHVISGIVNIPLIDSAIETAKEVRRVLREKDMISSGSDKQMRKFLVTDSAEKFARVGERFLGYEILDITKIELE
jgi:glutamate racemase